MIQTKDFEGQVQGCMRAFNRLLNPSTLFWDGREGVFKLFPKNELVSQKNSWKHSMKREEHN